MRESLLHEQVDSHAPAAVGPVAAARMHPAAHKAAAAAQTAGRRTVAAGMEAAVHTAVAVAAAEDRRAAAQSHPGHCHMAPVRHTVLTSQVCKLIYVGTCLTRTAGFQHVRVRWPWR